jgi:hypothetical protein
LGGHIIKVEDLRKDPSIKEWLRLIRPKPTTEITYLEAMKIFTDWINKTPDELIREAEDEAENKVMLRPNVLMSLHCTLRCTFHQFTNLVYQ